MGRTFVSDPFSTVYSRTLRCFFLRVVILRVMNAQLVGVLALVVCAPAFARKPAPAPLPAEFEIGRHTFLDFGPPHDYYEIIVVRPASNGSSVERLLLTPAAGCYQPAKAEVTTGKISESISELLSNTNPCSIPEKELRRELKRCKRCMVFSFANVTMHVQCSGQDRLIRADILDRDMFDPSANTPKNTSWTMQFLAKLDHALGPGVMDKPVFPGVSTPQQDSAPEVRLDWMNKVQSGGYDSLFSDTPDKASEIYKSAQIPAPQPSVRLVSSTPISPLTFVRPGYPPMAKLARVEGDVDIGATIAADGTVKDIEYKSGSPLFRAAVEEAARKWKFPVEAAGEKVELHLQFSTNCPK
jgi:TonB family protein